MRMRGGEGYGRKGTPTPPRAQGEAICRKEYEGLPAVVQGVSRGNALRGSGSQGLRKRYQDLDDIFHR